MNEKEYWNQLIKEIKAFDQESKIDSILDQNEYTKLRDTLLDIANHGIKALTALSPFAIKEHITQAEALMKGSSFDEKGIPIISGKKTKNFIELVYLTHLRRLQDVEFSVATQAAVKLFGKNISAQRVKVNEMAKKLEELLRQYDEQKLMILT